ncbi:MAG: triose-phosphate isomerase, partial [Candidatus Dadabacteria bacterium]|nr:triose-phosphate isomerase [Candidatus Dadabacteria bacterium]
MNKKLVVGNWKMNLLREEAREFSGEIVDLLGEDYDACQVVLVPPYTALDVVGTRISGSNIDLGAQNVFGKISGAFTGEVSAPMLLDAGCKWVILGHSERRLILGETDEQIREKLLLSISCGLKAILCVGETEAQREEAIRESEDASTRKRLLFSPIRTQMESALHALDEEQVSDIVIAYEPVWAIGTGKNATSLDIAEIHQYIRQPLTEMFPGSGSSVKILYGGSVKTGNIVKI